jgi:hypothetical protein
MSPLVPIEELFNGRHSDQEIVILCVHWYLSFKLSSRDLVADPYSSLPRYCLLPVKNTLSRGFPPRLLCSTLESEPSVLALDESAVSGGSGSRHASRAFPS